MENVEEMEVGYSYNEYRFLVKMTFMPFISFVLSKGSATKSYFEIARRRWQYVYVNSFSRKYHKM